MANLDITFNPQKAIKKKDLLSMAKMIEKAAKDKKIDGMTITMTNDRKDGPTAMAFHFLLTEEK